VAKHKLPKRLFKGQDRVSSYETGKSPRKMMEKLSGEHEDVLQNIEFVLVTAHRDDPEVDDRVVSDALRSFLGGPPPADPLTQQIAGSLADIRQLRAEIPEHVWRDALRVVHDSVKRHSQLQPGETSYLDFVDEYIR
jgi:hypothetical protein